MEAIGHEINAFYLLECLFILVALCFNSKLGTKYIAKLGSKTISTTYESKKIHLSRIYKHIKQY